MLAVGVVWYPFVLVFWVRKGKVSWKCMEISGNEHFAFIHYRYVCLKLIVGRSISIDLGMTGALSHAKVLDVRFQGTWDSWTWQPKGPASHQVVGTELWEVRLCAEIWAIVLLQKRHRHVQYRLNASLKSQLGDEDFHTEELPQMEDVRKWGCPS